MLHTLHSAEQAAHIPAPPLDIPFSLSSKALLLFEVLYSVGVRVAERRAYSSGVSMVHFFALAEIVAHACGMARSTLYVKLAELRKVGLVQARAHYVTHKGRTKADGSCWAVKLRNFNGAPAKVPHDALKASYRCLSADIEAGRTAWAQIRQSKDIPREQSATEQILAWADTPSNIQSGDKHMTVRYELEQVLDVRFVPKEDRAQAVDGAARALASSLGDAGGLMFYRFLLWRLLKLEQTGRAAPWYWVYEQARRVRSEAQEGSVRRPGALFTARLKAAPWWDAVWCEPPTRVGLALEGIKA